MTRDGCAHTMERIVQGKEGLVDEKVSYKDKAGEFVYDPQKMTKFAPRLLVMINGFHGIRQSYL